MRNATNRHIKTNVKNRVKQNVDNNYWPHTWSFVIYGRTTEEVREKAKRMKEIADERRE